MNVVGACLKTCHFSIVSTTQDALHEVSNQSIPWFVQRAERKAELGIFIAKVTTVLNGAHSTWHVQYMKSMTNQACEGNATEGRSNVVGTCTTSKDMFMNLTCSKFHFMGWSNCCRLQPSLLLDFVTSSFFELFRTNNITVWPYAIKLVIISGSFICIL